MAFVDAEGTKHVYRYCTVSRIIDELVRERGENYRFAKKFENVGRGNLGRRAFAVVASYDEAIRFAEQKKAEFGEKF